MEQHESYPQPNPVPAGAPYEPRVPMAPVISMGQWLVTMLIMVVPLVNIILLIVWASSSSENPNRKHWAVAQLIFMVVGIALYALMMATFGAALLSAFGK